MGSLSFAEIVTILLVVLVIFGPNRLPEFARKIGELMAQARRATSQFSKDISTEWGDAVEPIMAVKEDFDGVKKDLKDATAAITGLGATAKPTADERTADTADETADTADETAADETADETAPDETADETAAEDGTEEGGQQTPKATAADDEQDVGES
jgi:sec-independent protein translocase protein TatB